jgi:hypothetical protein
MTDSSFEPGCGTLINSLYQNGYRGKIIIGLISNGHLLPKLIKAQSPPGLVFEFVNLRTQANVNYHKPSLLLHAFDDGTVTKAFFFDSDIICTKEWSHFLNWVDSGIAVCSDINHLWMPPSHPVRNLWKKLLAQHGYEFKDVSGYANGGFLGVSRAHIEIVRIWEELLSWLTFSNKTGWDDWSLKAGFEKYDQDLLNASLMAVECPVSFVGYEGMSFAESVGYMVHPVGPLKPWHKGYLKHLLLHGAGMPLANRQYWKYARSPLHNASPMEEKLAKIEMNLTAFLSRFMSK